MDDAANLRSALDVVAQALLSRSEAEASARITAAEERAKDIVAEGLAHAEDITRSAEAEGTRSAESEAGHRLARGRRKARRAVLGARMVAMERLHAETLAAVDELRRRPDYPNLEDGLADLAMTALGPDAELERDPELRGGVRARAGFRTVDLTLPSLAERCLQDLRTDLETLWE
jgi:vacuolar-type H+-ATPase subunit E/Vma4